MKLMPINWRRARLALLSLLSVGCVTQSLQAAEAREVPVFITIGQSNADGSAFFNSDEDSRLLSWYSSEANGGNLKIWYRSTQVQNQTANSLGEAARWVVNGTTTDVDPGWLNLWYRNENLQGRTAMNMIHSYGTYSTGSDTNCAQGRRGMEGQFGMKFAQAFPDQELYIIKLGVSGSFISSWANPADNHNWDYFFEYMYKPAIEDLLARGLRPRLAGIWWMQGCADSGQTDTYYEVWLRTLINKCRADLGFDGGKFYIGHIVAPGESTVTPAGSTSYSANVRNAQDIVANSMEGVEIIDTKDCPMQYESAFSGYIHFSHAGVNAIGDLLAEKVAADGADNWKLFSTPGTWSSDGTFTPSIGNPTITYAREGNNVTATLAYDGWTETKTHSLSEETGGSSSPGYLEFEGTRYAYIPHTADLDIQSGESRTITMKVWLDAYSGTYRRFLCNRYNPSGSGNTGNTTGYDFFSGLNNTQSFSNNINLHTGSWNNLGHPYINTINAGEWAHIAWVLDASGKASRLYINGVMLSEKTNDNIGSYPIDPQCDILIGAYYTTDASGSVLSSDYRMKGKIDDLRMYTRALSTDEVAADMTATVNAETPDLLLAYDFTTLRGTNCPDISGNGHNAVLVNFPDYSTTGSVLTIEQPAGATGTITVSDGTSNIASGSRVDDGTVLAVTATPGQDYFLQSIYVNGTELAGNTFTMNGPTTVSATFTRDPSAPTRSVVFDMYEAGSKYYRIPAIETAADGSIIALADKRGASNNDLPNTISVVAKRSTDGGETWSEAVTLAQGDSNTGKTYGDPALVRDRNTGRLIAIYCGDTGFFTSTKTNRDNIYMSTSDDNGVTWTGPINISDYIYQDSWYGSFAASGSILQTKSGRIMFVVNARLSSATWLTQVYEFVVASDDGGETWQVLNPDGRVPGDGQGNESKLVELEDGSLIMSIRAPGKRLFSRSTDGGVTWSATEAIEDLVEPGCNGDVLLYPSPDNQSRLIHSLTNDPTSRKNVSVLMSYDGGVTWPVKKTLVSGSSGYSSLTVLADGSLGCFVEEGNWDASTSTTDGYRLCFMKFDLDWLTDGQDVPTVDPITDGYTFTFGEVDEQKGSIDVYRGEYKAATGRKYADGTVLTVVPNPLDGYVVETITVNGVAIAPVGGAYNFEIHENVVVAATFMRDPDAPLAYCYPVKTYTSTDRQVTSITFTDSQGNTASINGTEPVIGGCVFFDRTAETFTTSAGQSVNMKVAGSGEWMHCYFYIDYGRDGEFDVPDGLVAGQTGGDVIAYNHWKGMNSSGSSIDGHRFINNETFNFILPSDLQPGRYRARFKLDWNDIDPCATTPTDANGLWGNSGGIVDFSIIIEGEQYDNPRTVTIASDDSALGSVTFVSPESSDASITTAQKVVTVKAIPAAGASFINWTNSANEIVGTEATYIYAGEANETLTAHFGYKVTYSANEFGTLRVLHGSEAIDNGTVLVPGSAITIEATANAGCRLMSLTANGAAIDNGATLTVNSATNIVAQFTDAPCTLLINIEGNGTVQAASDYDDTTDALGGSFFASGAALQKGTGVFFLFTPAEGYLLSTASVIGAADGDFAYPGEFTESVLTAGVYWCYADASDVDLNVSALFVKKDAAIDGINADNNSTVEYFNLQGLRVNSENLLPGFYIARKGNKAVKVYISK